MVTWKVEDLLNPEISFEPLAFFLITTGANAVFFFCQIFLLNSNQQADPCYMTRNFGITFRFMQRYCGIISSDNFTRGPNVEWGILLIQDLGELSPPSSFYQIYCIYSITDKRVVLQKWKSVLLNSFSKVTLGGKGWLYFLIVTLTDKKRLELSIKLHPFQILKYST